MVRDTQVADINIIFTQQETQITSDSVRSQLDKLISFIKTRNPEYIVVKGLFYKGNQEQQEKTAAQSRAKAVGQYLSQNGIKGVQVDVIGISLSSDKVNKNQRQVQVFIP